jgi:hydroxyacylglutathione hydrolase
MKLLSLAGPTVVGASVVYAYLANHPTAAQVENNTAYVFPCSTFVYCSLLFLVYATGQLPRNPFFPAFVFRSNIFPLLYKLYCSYGVGYRFLSGIMHQPVAYPHSDYRNGIRCLDAGSPLRRKVPPVGTKNALPFLQHFYARGGGVVDSALWSGSTSRGVVVVPVPMFADNYAYLIVSLQTKKVAVVDPADPEMVLRFLSSLRGQLQVPLQLTEVLTTHKHWDHAGGNKALAEYAKTQPSPPVTKEGTTTAAETDTTPLVAPNLRIIGSDVDRPLSCTEFVNDATPAFEVAGGGAKVRAMSAPGHTCGSLVFVVGTAEAEAASASPACVAVFTGDSLFSGGCGAPFETVSITQIVKARATFLEDNRIRTQPATGQVVAEEDVLLYVGHEYTERLLQEVVKLMTRAVQSRGSEVDKRGLHYIRAAAEALRGVKVLREESDGLKDASLVGRDDVKQKPTFRLPSCTIPTSLAVEKRVNPLLTVDKEVLAGLAQTEKAGEMDASAVERAIYCSDRRTVPLQSGNTKELA